MREENHGKYMSAAFCLFVACIRFIAVDFLEPCLVWGHGLQSLL